MHYILHSGDKHEGNQLFEDVISKLKYIFMTCL